jgi:hypothetical protein
MTQRFGPYGGAQSPPAYIAARGKGAAPPSPTDLGRALALQSWDQHKPPTAQDFYSFTPTSLTLPAGANSTVATTDLTGGFIQLAADNIGVLQTVIFTIDAPTTAMSIRFTVFANGGGIPGLSNIGFPPINATTFAFPLSSTWQLAPGSVLTVQFVNLNAAGPWTLGVVLSGYQVSAADVQAYTGERLGTIEGRSERFKKFLAR